VLHLTVDSIGFSPISACTYYVKTLKRRDGKPERPWNRREVKHYMKQTVAAETRKQLIVAVKSRQGPTNDPPDFVNVLKKVEPAGLPVRIVMADKGYDAELNHEYTHEALGARTAIPVRAASRPKIEMRGKHRRRQAPGVRPVCIQPAAEGGDGVLCGEAEDGVDCAGSQHEPAAQGVDPPGVLILICEEGVSLFALHRGFLQSMKVLATKHK
jgi:hypothetical protein